MTYDTKKLKEWLNAVMASDFGWFRKFKGYNGPDFIDEVEAVVLAIREHGFRDEPIRDNSYLYFAREAAQDGREQYVLLFAAGEAVVSKKDLTVNQRAVGQQAAMAILQAIAKLSAKVEFEMP